MRRSFAAQNRLTYFNKIVVDLIVCVLEDYGVFYTAFSLSLGWFELGLGSYSPKHFSIDIAHSNFRYCQFPAR